MENIKTPSFKGCKPCSEEWLDDDTFVINFAVRKDKDTVNVLYAEVHLDENNAVVIGENIYEGDTLDYIDTNYHCVGDEIYNEIDMDENTANEIKKYALTRMMSEQ